MNRSNTLGKLDRAHPWSIRLQSASQARRLATRGMASRPV